MANGIAISAAVEGVVDEAVLRTLIAFVGATAGPVYGGQGKPFLQQRIAGYNAAAHHAPWIVVVDLDHDYDCAPSLRVGWLPKQAPYLCFRVAVRAVEAWLLADAERIAAFLDVPRNKVPLNPEALDNPKASMVALGRASRRKDMREDIVPRAGSGRQVGPAYASRLIEFAHSHWRPGVGAEQAESLSRAIDCLRYLASHQ